MKGLVQREGSLIKPRQSQNRISGFSTEYVFCDWRGLINQIIFGGCEPMAKQAPKARDFYGGPGDFYGGTGKILKFGSLKWHFQHSEKTFWKMFRLSKHFKIQNI